MDLKSGFVGVLRGTPRLGGRRLVSRGDSQKLCHCLWQGVSCWGCGAWLSNRLPLHDMMALTPRPAGVLMGGFWGNVVVPGA